MKKKRVGREIRVIDLFAGPGGLGEGFAAFSSGARKPFRLALSVEKDPRAHRTLKLRSFFRQFPAEKAPSRYYELLRETGRPLEERLEELYAEFPKASKAAEAEALCEELNSSTSEDFNRMVAERLGGRDSILIGGPPCQAYSIVGRSRNRGIAGYRPENDNRQFLYLEYLQTLFEQRPLVFIMENVSGLLSASVRNQQIFERIVDDLQDPVRALREEGRRTHRPRRDRVRYRLHSLVAEDTEDLRNFLIPMDRYGIPQSRKRLIILGIRDDLWASNPPRLLKPSEHVPVSRVIGTLPPLRSGLSKETDSGKAWCRTLRKADVSGWARELEDMFARRGLRAEVPRKFDADLDQGGDFVDWNPSSDYAPEWFLDRRIKGAFNHMTKKHMSEDLHRYLFVASFARVTGRSPRLRDFPAGLLPKHRNVQEGKDTKTFADRFRVILPDEPGKTVTSHIAKDGHAFIHPDPSQCRALTVREVARIQTFPDNYYFCGGLAAQYWQVGNAVPPLLSNQIAAIVYGFLKDAGVVG